MNRQPASSRGITALYERLSHDDEQQGPSNSILNQQQLLEECAKKHKFPAIVHFTDDGCCQESDRVEWQWEINRAS